VAQLGDPQFVNELTDWLRFNAAEAEHRGDGLFGPSFGMPAIPRWIGRVVMRILASARAQNEKDLRYLRSSAGVAVFVSDHNDPEHWLDVGRRYERFALQATALGLRNAFMNQPVEVASLRGQLATWLGIADRRPDLMVRFGYGA
jgi:hypothetical protein